MGPFRVTFEEEERNVQYRISERPRSLARSVFPFEWWRGGRFRGRRRARGVAAKGRVVFYLDNSNEIFARREKEVWLTETETGERWVRSFGKSAN